MEFEFDAAAVAVEYGANAADYAATFSDNLETNDFDRAVLMHVLASVPADGLVLDAGCGPAQGAAFVAARGLRAIGLDLTQEMLEAARERVTAPLVRGDLRALPFANASFDAVLAWYSLLHLPTSSMPGALAGIRRVMRVGAPLVIAMQGGRSGESATQWSDYSASEVTAFLVAAGFVDVVTRTRPPRPHEYQVTKIIASAVR